MSLAIARLREEFQRQYSIYISSGEFDATDVNRLLTDDSLCASFIRVANQNCTNLANDSSPVDWHACLLLIESAFKWRKRDQINSLSADSLVVLNGERAGSARFLNGFDRCRRPVLLIRAADYPRNMPPDQLTAARQYIGWLLESRYHRADQWPVGHNQISLLLDMSGCSVSLSGAFNIDLLKFLVQACSVYYPDCLARLLIYEMPWVLTAAYQFLRTWFDRPTQAKVAFVWRSTLKDFIDLRHLPERMGGLAGDYQDELDAEDDEDYSCQAASPAVPVRASGARVRKSVSFCSAQPDVDNDRSSTSEPSSMLVTSSASPSTYSSTTSRRLRINRGILKLRSTVDNESVVREGSQIPSLNDQLSPNELLAAENSFVGRYLTVSPADRLDFPCLDAAATAGSARCTVRLLNSSPTRWVAYKVRTTAPIDYRVKPTCSAVPPNSCVSIVVVRRNNCTTDISSGCARPKLVKPVQLVDRLQIIAAPLSDAPLINAATYCGRELAIACFKSAKPDQLMEHRLLCRLVRPANSTSSSNSVIHKDEVMLESAEQLSARIADLRSTIDKMAAGNFSIVGSSSSASPSVIITTEIRLIYLLLLVAAFLVGWILSAFGSRPFDDLLNVILEGFFV